VGVVDVIGDAEAAMREYVYPFMLMTTNHDSNFGGGGLDKLTEHASN
jgi:hypothetical protein